MGSMTPRRYPVWDICWLVFFAAGFVWCNLVIMACLWLDKPLEWVPVNLAIVVAMLVGAAKDLDRYTFKREHLMAERKLTREYRGYSLRGLVLRDRVDRRELDRADGLLPSLHASEARTRAAFRVADGYRALRHGLK